MLLTIVSYRLPGLTGAAHTALRVMLLTLALLAAVALVVAVCMAVAPHLPTLLVGVAVTGLYAVATYPKAKVQSCK
jgi:hypothetical protein